MTATQTTARQTPDTPASVSAEKAAEAQRVADAKKAAQPKTANEVLAKVDEDHNWSHDPIDMSTTGGIQKATERNWKAIQALANFVDGKKTV